jgi:hypothetical protein
MARLLQRDQMRKGVKKKKIAIILEKIKSMLVLDVAQMERHFHKDHKTKDALNAQKRYH